jgi:ATP-dependent RNA helicase RhlE
MGFSQLGLHADLNKGIAASGYTAPTQIQAAAIPLALEGKDIIGCAQTGTGKTAAFVLPILHKLERTNGIVRALVITPTRELAAQAETCVRDYNRFMNIRSFAVFGGVNIEPQIKQLRRGADILIATPGRLLDLIHRRVINLGAIEFLVLDEADRMLDMGFMPDIKRIISLVPAKRQTLLFSATIPPEIEKFAQAITIDAERITIGQKSSPADSVTQSIYPVRSALKVDLLLHLLQTNKMQSILIFSRTKHGADRIAKFLERKNFTVARLHSNRTQAQRQQALAGFKQGRYQILVATDIAARGIDVDNISHVINFDTPNYPEDYVHRIGRTGRASAIGDAFTLVSPDEERHLKGIERFIGRRLPRLKIEDFDYTKAKESLAPSDRRNDAPDSRSGRSDGRYDHRGRNDRPNDRHQQSGHRESSGHNAGGSHSRPVPAHPHNVSEHDKPKHHTPVAGDADFEEQPKNINNESPKPYPKRHSRPTSGKPATGANWKALMESGKPAKGKSKISEGFKKFFRKKRND